MAAAETSKLVGFRKKDIDKNWAEIVVRINHLKDRRDVIEVSYPSNRSEPFVVRLNDSIVCEKLLPGSIIKKDCSHKVKHGHKGEVKIKLRKSQPEDWMHRWSPSRETRPPPSITSSSGESSSIYNSDHMDITDVGISDENKPTFKIEEL